MWWQWKPLQNLQGKRERKCWLFAAGMPTSCFLERQGSAGSGESVGHHHAEVAFRHFQVSHGLGMSSRKLVGACLKREQPPSKEGC